MLGPYSLTGVVEVIRSVVAQGFQVLGLDGFEVAGAVIHRRLDLIFDSSSRQEVSDPSEIVAHWPADIWIDMAIQG